MKKRVVALILTMILLFGSANAEFYTANEDVYYHAKADCIAGSTFEISEKAAVQFEKLACPVCVDRKSVGGEMLVLPLPQEKDFYSEGCDLRDGKILICGYTVKDEKAVPFLKTFDMQGNELDSLKDLGESNWIREAVFLPDGRIAAVVVKGFPDKNESSIVLIEDMRISQTLVQGGWFGCIHAAEDSFFVTGDPEFDGVQRLAKFDLQGNPVWMTKDFAETASGNGMIESESGVIVYGYRDVHDENSETVVAAVDDSGNFVHGPDLDAVNRLGDAMHGLRGLVQVNGEAVYCESANSIIPWKDGYLAAMYVFGSYVRIVQCNAEGKPVRDWIEEAGEINNSLKARLLRDGDDAYLYVYGTTPKQLTGKDAWSVYGFPETQAIVKKLEVEQ